MFIQYWEPSHRLSDDQALLVEVLFSLPKTYKEIDLLSVGELGSRYRLQASDYNPQPHASFWNLLWQICDASSSLGVEAGIINDSSGVRSMLICIKMASTSQSPTTVAALA